MLDAAISMLRKNVILDARQKFLGSSTVRRRLFEMRENYNLP